MFLTGFDDDDDDDDGGGGGGGGERRKSGLKARSLASFPVTIATLYYTMSR